MLAAETANTCLLQAANVGFLSELTESVARLGEPVGGGIRHARQIEHPGFFNFSRDQAKDYLSPLEDGAAFVSPGCSVLTARQGALWCDLARLYGT